MEEFQTFDSFLNAYKKRRIFTTRGVFLGDTQLISDAKYRGLHWVKLSKVYDYQVQNAIPLSLFSEIELCFLERKWVLGELSDRTGKRCVRLFYTKPDFEHLYLVPDGWSMQVKVKPGTESMVIPQKNGKYPFIIAPDERYTRLWKEDLSILQGHIYQGLWNTTHSLYTDQIGAMMLV